MTDEIHGQGEDLVVVLDAPDWASAEAAKSVLEDCGVPAVLLGQASRSVHIGQSEYARVAVPRGHAGKARELLETGCSSVGESEETIGEPYDSRHTVAGWRATCVLMTAFAVLACLLVAGRSSAWWSIPMALALAWTACLFVHYLKTAAPRFHSTARTALMACIPVGAALVLVTVAEYVSSFDVSHRLLMLLCATSAGGFVGAAVTHIPAENKEVD